MQTTRFQPIYSELNLNQYSVGSPCRNVCTIFGSPPCPDLNLIHYTFAKHSAAHIVRSKPGNTEAAKPANLNIKTQALIRFDVARIN
ncbi:hypothetical protein [Eikenella corrodens]|uniref:Uncharacterized protein n=1 Tax=Eikenella corrodens TaxID=539 RepID=A0A3S9SJ74_EIKCO|nr:hypothetical protein [Eikenella corrodens]AZR59542.1 hypothetical protein ELB75_05585 [Eikenella corrodens]